MNIQEALLVMVAEEAAEVAQAACKCLRFTPHHAYSEYKKSNLDRLQEELIDLTATVGLLLANINKDDSYLENINESTRVAMQRKIRSIEISKSLGAVQ
jgi:NTP pyrophosphatase (non-canonical NTP hydrolase)